MALEFSGKSVLIVDGAFASAAWGVWLITRPDSIVRGTTSKEIIQMAKDVGARKVIFASCAPPIRYTFASVRLSQLTAPSFSNVYGIDMPSREELIAYHRNPAQIAEALGADLVIYQTLPDLIRSVQQFNPKLTHFDCSVFTGEYVTGDIDERYLQHIESLRSEKVRLTTPAPPPSHGSYAHGGMTNGVRANGPTTSNLTAAMQMLADEDAMKRREAMASCSGPMNGADDNIGLHNTFNVGSV